MKRLLLSLLVVGAVVTATAAGTQAVFTDSDNIAGNTVSTATVEIDARGESRGGIMAKPIVATGLIPGEYTSWARGVVYNKANSTNVRVYMYVDNLTGDCGKINLRVTTGHANDGDPSERAHDIYKGALTGLVGAGNRKEVTGYIFNAPTYLPANTSAVLQQQAQLDPTAGNGYQGTTCTWNEVFVAETPVTT